MCNTFAGPYERALEIALSDGWDMELFDRAVSSLGVETVLDRMQNFTYIDPREL